MTLVGYIGEVAMVRRQRCKSRRSEAAAQSPRRSAGEPCKQGQSANAVVENPRKGIEVVVTRVPGMTLLGEWDGLVDRTPGTDVTQLSAWTRLRRLAGFSALYVLARQDGVLVGGAQIMTRRLPVIGSIGYLAYGPIIAPGVEHHEEILRPLADALAELGRRQLRILYVQPPEGADDVSNELLRRGFRESSVGIAPAGSVRIDLTDDLAVIKGRFSRTLRSWPNRWPARGVTVRPGDERDVPLLVELLGRSAGEQGHTPLPYHYVEALYRELASTGHASLFVGEVNGVPAAADLVTGCGDMLRGRLAGFDRSGEASKLGVPAAVRWEIIQWGKARGYRWYDFGGLRAATLDTLLVGGDPPLGGWPSVDLPKLKFGGAAFRYPKAVELISPAPLRMAYDLAWRSAAGRLLIERARVILRGNRPERHRVERPAPLRADPVGDTAANSQPRGERSAVRTILRAGAATGY